jgi:general secretion pathway protein G
LLIVVAIIGIIAAIAIPNLINAIQRGRQKRTMADIRTIGTAIMAYATDFVSFPKATMAGNVDLLQTYIIPTFIQKMPNNDGWGRPIIVNNDPSGASFTVYSTGRSGSGAIGAAGPTTNFDQAIVFSNGQFAQWPEGMQAN